MNEKRIKKIEKHIAGGVVRRMLLKGIEAAAIAAFVVIILRSLFYWKLNAPDWCVAMVISWFIIGCFSGFSSWDHLVGERRIKKIEERIAGGVVRHMLLKGVWKAAMGVLIFSITRLFFDLRPHDLGQGIAIIIGFFVAGCSTSFSSWDRFVEERKKYTEQKAELDIPVTQPER